MTRFIQDVINYSQSVTFLNEITLTADYYQQGVD